MQTVCISYYNCVNKINIMCFCQSLTFVSCHNKNSSIFGWNIAKK